MAEPVAASRASSMSEASLATTTSNTVSDGNAPSDPSGRTSRAVTTTDSDPAPSPALCLSNSRRTAGGGSSSMISNTAGAAVQPSRFDPTRSHSTEDRP